MSLRTVTSVVSVLTFVLSVGVARVEAQTAPLLPGPDLVCVPVGETLNCQPSVTPLGQFTLPADFWKQSALTFTQVTPDWHPIVTHWMIGSAVISGSMAASLTSAALATGTFHEGNFFMRRIAGNPAKVAAVKTGTTVAYGVLLVKQRRNHPKLVLVSAIGMAFVNGVDMVHDYRAYQRYLATK